MESITVMVIAIIIFSFTTTATILFSLESSMSFEIKTSWDNLSLDHQPTKFTLSCQQNDDHLTVHFKAPFFNDARTAQWREGKTISTTMGLRRFVTIIHIMSEVRQILHSFLVEQKNLREKSQLFF